MDADAYPREVLADEEPKYLRRQKPLEIKRRKFGRQAWNLYLRAAVWIVVGVAGAWMAYMFGHFLLASPEMALLHPEQVKITGTRYVQKANVLGIFSADRSHSVLRIPLEQRRRQLEAIPWVERATVRRALPNKVEVEVAERTPIAFLRQGSDLGLVDLHGVILERPLKADFHFPVVTGVSSEMPLDEREKRMQMYAGFMQQVELARAGAGEQVSEVDLYDANDLRATIMGLQGAPLSSRSSGAALAQSDAPLLVHFGDGDFQGKYRTLLDNIGVYRAKAGRLESLDMRFNGEVVANPDTSASPRQVAQQVTPRVAPQHAPKPAPIHAAKKKSTRQAR
jgi:cell division protein FtsQ